MVYAYKFHGAGNDFIMLDEMSALIQPDTFTIEQWCRQHTGIGADGLIRIVRDHETSFRMMYYNSDGNEASMCGNGARCAAAFAFMKGYIEPQDKFAASDGTHHCIVEQISKNEWKVKVSLILNTSPVQMTDGSWQVHTGVPHNVRPVSAINDIDVVSEGRKIRHDKLLFPEGTNVNFVSFDQAIPQIRTYERGVENETLACGTGITASAIIAHQVFGLSWPVSIQARGGLLSVDVIDGILWLEGPAVHVFTAELL